MHGHEGLKALWKFSFERELRERTWTYASCDEVLNDTRPKLRHRKDRDREGRERHPDRYLRPLGYQQDVSHEAECHHRDGGEVGHEGVAFQEPDGTGEHAWFVSEFRLKRVPSLFNKEGTDIFLAHRLVIEFREMVRG